MKKLLRMTVLLLVLVTAFSCLGMFAAADVIWEPEDPFWLEHRDNCERENRSWIANGYQGKVIFYKSPEKNKKLGTVENGEKIYVSYIYTDPKGIRWALCDSWETNISGWCPMDYLAEVFDGTAFSRSFADRITSYAGDYPEEPVTGELVLWYWPGSPVTSTWELNGETLPAYHNIFVDDEGRTWGQIGYFYGYRNMWICVDAPTAEQKELFPDGIPDYNLAVEPYQGREIVPGGKKTEKPDKASEPEIEEPDEETELLVICAVSVGVVVLVTAALLVLLRRNAPKKKPPEQTEV